MTNYFLHNRRCQKSREALDILEASGQKYIMIEYLKSPLDFGALQDLQKKLGLKAVEFCRTKEKEFSVLGLSSLSKDDEILRGIERFPNLLERPIFIKNSKAVVCRPPEKIKELL